MKEFFKIIRFFLRHPIGRRDFPGVMRRFMAWQFSQRLVSAPVLLPFVDGTSMLVKKGMTGATGNYYLGLLEFEDMAFLLHMLRRGDLFVDVGSNVGAYSILAAGVGKANAISFEPAPAEAKVLKENVYLNSLQGEVSVREKAVGRQAGEVSFTTGLSSTNHVVTTGEHTSAKITVPVVTLDQELEATLPVVMKIDVEGYEWEVLHGASRVLGNPSLQAIVIELNQSGLRYGIEDTSIHQLLVEKGFTPVSYEPFSRALTVLATCNQVGNTIYVRDLEIASQRVKSAQAFRLLQFSV